MTPVDPIEEEDDTDSPRWWKAIKKHLNFYRIHVLYYIITPLIFSSIFYASNGKYHISYIDSLFNCVSAMTVCGLATINLSTLTGWQQAILFIQMCIGNPILISWVVVYQRRYYFALKFRHVFRANAERAVADALTNTEKPSTWSSRIATLLRGGRVNVPVVTEFPEGERSGDRKNGFMQKLRPEMIRRIDDEPKRINPSGLAVPLRRTPTVHNIQPSHPMSTPHLSQSLEQTEPKSRRNSIGYANEPRKSHFRRLSDPGIPSRPSSPTGGRFPRSDTVQEEATPLSQVSPELPKTFTRTQTIEFAPNVPRRRGRLARGMVGEEILENDRPTPEPSQAYNDHRSMHSRRASLSHQPSIATGYTHRTRASTRYKHRGFGGFPMPFALLKSLISYLFPKFKQKVTRTVTIPATMSLVSSHRDVLVGSKSVPYISFNATVGRNSAFQDLTHEEIEELGGVEYRALNALLWIVGGYHIITQLLVFVIIAPYISMPKWRQNFLPPDEVRPQNTAWFSIFQVASAYTNTGMSLVDRSMVPFQTAYPMLTFMIFLILAGNTAFPVFLRFTIWVLTKLVPKTSRANETLHFLLDHPRRCFILLFPSHQTWFLLSIVLGLTFTDWFFFLVLDIGNPVTEAIPLGTRFLVGLFQAVAVRSAGFVAVNLASLASAVKVLYVLMMYVSVYPIAMSIRSTNVYEEQSLGIFPRDDDFEEENFPTTGPRVMVWSRYLAMHARKQLAFDMWWLSAALFLVCISERHNLDDPSSAIWFNIFSVIFELVSAYGTVGLSLGTPNNNFSFAGELKSLSKFILCLVMIRGRHRALPVAIDRAVMLPSELQRQLDQYNETRSQFNVPRSSSRAPDDDGYDTRSRRYSTQTGENRMRNRDGGDQTSP